VPVIDPVGMLARGNGIECFTLMFSSSIKTSFTTSRSTFCRSTTLMVSAEQRNLPKKLSILSAIFSNNPWSIKSLSMQLSSSLKDFSLFLISGIRLRSSSNCIRSSWYASSNLSIPFLIRISSFFVYVQGVPT
jgi:hypothetical protein